MSDVILEEKEIAAVDTAEIKPYKKSFWKGFFSVFGKVMSCIGAFILTVLITAYAAGCLICYGPSPAAKSFFVLTVTETSALKFLANIYLPQSEIDEIIASSEEMGGGETTEPPVIPEDPPADGEPIEIITVKGDLYVGKLMIIKDPSRVSIYTIDNFDREGVGETLMEIYEKTEATAVINAGGFYDPQGISDGGMPLGYVFKDGQLVSYLATKYDTIIGFDAEHRLIVGKMTAQQAINKGIVDAVSFGPALVVNGNRAKISSSGALHPRTAIGQRADGAIMFLVVDGRQPHSIGISYKGLQDLMIEYGAINAANLDGGSSSMMIYEGEYLNKHSSVTGPRPVPTAFVIK